MSKKKKIRVHDDCGGLISSNKDTAIQRREAFRQYYTEKFFNKFLSKFKFNGLDEQQIAYLMRKFWADGTAAAYQVADLKEVMEEGENTDIIFTPYAPNGVWNIYNFPTKITLINTRGVDFIPTKALEVNKEAVIGFIQKNHKGIFGSIKAIIEKIVDFEMTIYVNLKALKTPWLIGVSPENKEKIKKLVEALDSDDPYLYIDLEDLELAKTLISGVNYNIDKLEQQRQQAENEALTYIGVDNVGVMQKKEHFTVDEVNANNEQINSSGDEFIDCLNDFFKIINKLWNRNISVSLKNSLEVSEDDKIEEEEENV